MNLDALKNPWVIGGGVLIGVVILMSRSGGSPASSNDAFISTVSEANRAGMELVALQTKASADIAVKRLDSNAKTQVAFFDLIKGLNNTAALRDVQMATVNAGITNNRLQTFAAMEMDRTMNMTRMALGKLDAKVSLAQIAANVKIAKINAEASKDMAVTNAIGSVASLGIKSAFSAIGGL